MKREFLQNFKVGEQALPKEIIDAIMEENGRDIESAKKPFADYESLKERLKAAKDGLAAFKDVDVDKLQGKITELTGQLADKDKQWQEKLDGMAFDGRIKDAITAAKGRNAKAIAALLDTDALRTSKNQETDIKAALDALKKDNGYLFETETPPPYASGTGTQGTERGHEPMTLSGALHAKYDKNYFNPRPPRGGRQSGNKILDHVKKFQSTPPARGGDMAKTAVLALLTMISIHAPREGGDGMSLSLLHRTFSYFNPRPPRGGRPPRSPAPAWPVSLFQSTPPARGATDRPPRAAECWGFQSTPPARGATRRLLRDGR